MHGVDDHAHLLHVRHLEPTLGLLDLGLGLAHLGLGRRHLGRLGRLGLGRLGRGLGLGAGQGPLSAPLLRLERDHVEVVQQLR